MTKRKEVRLHGHLVSREPSLELKSKDSLAPILGSLPRFQGDTVSVPQGSDRCSQAVSDILLYDQALTPDGVPGAERIPSWALDTARLARAKYAMGRAYDYKRPSNRASALSSKNTELISQIKTSTKSNTQAAAAKYRLSTVSNSGNCEPGVSAIFGDMYYGNPQTWNDVLDFAGHLVEQDRQEKEEQQKEEEKPEAKKPSPDNDYDEMDEETGEDNTPNEGETGSRYIEGLDEDAVAEMAHNPKAANWGDILNEGNWDVLPMSPRRRKGGIRSGTEEGVVPSKWHRLALDGKIFGGRRRHGGSNKRGSICVDLSGSMSWTRRSIDELLCILPEATVFGYAGNGENGRIILLMDRGRSANADDVRQWLITHHLGGNEIDGPCLEMMCRMPTPRIWISDGHVTGRGCSSYMSSNLMQHAAVLQKKGGIVRANNAHHACQIIKTRNVPLNVL